MTRDDCRRAAASALACVVLLAAAAAQADDKQIITAARGAYYNLDKHAFAQLQCEVTPNWNIALRNLMKKDPEAAKSRLKLLQRFKFAVALGAEGSAKVTHNDIKPPNAQQAQAYQKIYGGVVQMLVGFFDTWNLFVRNSPLPAVDSEYKLKNHDGRWQLTYKEGTAEIYTDFDKNYAIHELKVSAQDFVSSIHPQFARTGDGLLFNSYQADYRSKAGDLTQLQARIDYQTVDGFRVPARMEMRGATKGQAVAGELGFTACKAAKR